jgi:geranylgeranylglycerol-phosphate geranylgeranyltransferase
VAVLRAIFQLTRLETSLLGFFAVLIPVFARSNDLYSSFRKAAPFLFIAVCTFIANDLDDLDRDRINHPNRPLPAGYISPVFAVTLYFIFLGLALTSIWWFISPGIDFFYYSAISLAISYGYISEYLPVVKPLFVAIAATVPILIVAASYPSESKLYVLAGSIFLLTLGREMCKDIRDRAGDPISIMHRFTPIRLGVIAFSLQWLGLLLLVILIHRAADLIDFVAMTLLLGLSTVLWFELKRYKLPLILMKIQLFVGLYFLV